MLLQVSDRFHCPVCVVSASVWVLSYGDSVGWAESYASLAVDAVFFFAAYGVGFFIVEVGVVGALVNAYFATYATLLVSFDEVFRYYICFHYIKPPEFFGLFFSLQTTASPPLGHQNLSRFGETSRIADSSEDKYR